MNMVLPILKLMRPHQWSKNLLVFVSLLVGHQYHDMKLLALTMLCFCALCLVASAGYAFNDLVDLEDDRNHPQKRYRPLPAGQLSRTTAISLSLVLAIAGLLLAARAGPYVLLCLFIYLTVNLAYTTWLWRSGNLCAKLRRRHRRV